MDAAIFMPLTKAREAQRVVYGVISAEAPDRNGEVCDYASTKPLYQAWSAVFSRVTNGKSLGNVRAMDGKVAAGKLVAVNFNDAKKQIEIVAKIVDDAEWDKVEQGVYTGFSQGGGCAKRWTDDAGVKRYTLVPDEVSLVDTLNAEPPMFSLVKADGMIELRHLGPFAGIERKIELLERRLAEIDPPRHPPERIANTIFAVRPS